MKRQYDTFSVENEESKSKKSQGSLFSKNAKASKIQRKEDKTRAKMKQGANEIQQNNTDDMTILMTKKNNGHKELFDDFPIEMIKRKSPNPIKIPDSSDGEIIKDDESLAKITESNELESNENNKHDNQLLMDFDEEMFRKESSDDDQLDLLQLREIDEKVDKSRASKFGCNLPPKNI